MEFSQIDFHTVVLTLCENRFLPQNQPEQNEVNLVRQVLILLT